jgi:Dolichyl-phosphate-mannose-protein mannosyltransferase
MRWPSDLPPFWRRLVAICALAALARLLYVLFIAQHATGLADFYFYNQTADFLADGKGYIRADQLGATALHPPLWPLVLSVVSAFSNDAVGPARTTFQDHRMVGVVLGPVMVLLLGLLGRRVGGERVGLASAALGALYPPFIAMDGSTMSETLYGPLMAGILLVAYRVYDRPSWKAAVGFGVLIGLATLTRAETLILLVLLGAPLASHAGAGRRLKIGAAMAAASVVVISPWVIRNLADFHSLTLSTNEGGALLGANCARTYNGGKDLGYWTFTCVPGRSDLNEADQSDLYRRMAFDYARGHADRLPVALAVRFLRVWGLYQPFRPTAEAQPPWVFRVGAATYLLVLALAVWGFVLIRRRRQTVWILLTPIALVCLIGLVFYGVARFRYGAELSLVVFAAAALVWLGERAAERLRSRTASSAKAAAAQATAPRAT